MRFEYRYEYGFSDDNNIFMIIGNKGLTEADVAGLTAFDYDISAEDGY